MSDVHYYYDSKQGVSRKTSHPQFVSFASEDFYYDINDDFSPFGNDAGMKPATPTGAWGKEVQAANGIIISCDGIEKESLIKTPGGQVPGAVPRS